MSIRLRQLIRQVRACKTAAEERAVIATECALIRTSFKEGNESNRSRNVAKLLYMHMLGYPSHFGQMECLKLIASPSFPDKRVGYLGLMLLLQEKDEVLMLGTNSLKSDLSHQLPQVVGLALCAVGNLATPDMSRDLAMEVDKHLQPGTSASLRKKAALCTVRVLRKCPELVEDFVDRVVTLLVERSHGVVLCGVQLLIAILEIDPDQASGLVKVLPSLVRLMRNLLSTGFSSEYDVAGVTDPFLQVRVLRLLRLLGQHSPDASEDINSVLSQVATTTETAKNAGNAILYECVQTIMKLESDSSLRSMAINILGRFLLHRDNNMRYVALTMLGRVVSHDLGSVQRHRATIVDCLKDPDPSIRIRAIDLIFQLVSRSSARAMVAELLNYLVVAPSDQKRELCSKILLVLEDHAPSARWRVDTLIRMLGIAGAECDRSIPSAAVVYVTQNEDLHAHAAHKTFRMLQADTSQLGLTLAGVWFAGEYGDLLLRPCAALPPDEGVEGEEGVDGSAADWGNIKDKRDASADSGNGSKKASKALAAGFGLGDAYSAVQGGEIVGLMAKVMKGHSSDRVTKGYVLTALTKLAGRLGEEHEDTIENLLQTYNGSLNLELQARSCEYSQLLRPELGELKRGMLDRMPVADEETVRNRRARFRADDKEDEDGGKRGGDRGGDEDDEDEARSLPSFRISKARQQRRGNGTDGSGGAASRGSKKVYPLAGPTPPSGGIMGGPAGPGGTKPQQDQPVANLLDLDDLFGGGSSSAAEGGNAGAGGVLLSGSSPAVGGAGEAAPGAGGLPVAGAAPGPATVDLMADIFSAPLAPSATAKTGTDPFSGTPAAVPGPTSVAPAAGGEGAVAGLGSLLGDGGGVGSSILSSPVTGASLATPPAPFTAFQKDGLVIKFELSKPSPSDPATTHVKATFGNTGKTEVTGLHFQAAVPKYLRLEMQPASGSAIPPGAVSGVQQNVVITNSMQGQKNLLMKLKISYERSGTKVQEMASVNSFPAGY